MSRRLLYALALIGCLITSPSVAATWYIDSVSYAAVTQWAALTTYAVGNIRRNLAAVTEGSERVWRVTAITTGISGAAEPTWNKTDASTTTDSGVTWTECTGNSAHQHDNGVTTDWTCPGGRISEFTAGNGKNVLAAGDTVYFGSDHNETDASAVTVSIGTVTSPLHMISVNKAGSVPPVAADYAPCSSTCATLTGQSTMTINNVVEAWGITFISGSGGAAAVDTVLGGTRQVFNDGSIQVLTTSSARTITTGGNGQVVTLNNTTVKFGATGQSITPANADQFVWLNTPTTAILGATFPTVLFKGNQVRYVVSGVDLSAISGTLVQFGGSSAANAQMLMSNCKINGSVTTVAAGMALDGQYFQMVNCDSAGDVYRSEAHSYQGDVTTDISVTRVGGFTNGITPASHKYISQAAAHVNKLAAPMKGIPIQIWNSTLSARTATIELIGSASVNNDDVWGVCQSLDSSGSPVGTSHSSYPATPLTAAAAVTSSSATWNNPPATPVTQHIQIAFTPALAGPVQCTVYVGKVSTTIWVDPLITLSLLAPANDNELLLLGAA